MSLFEPKCGNPYAVLGIHRTATEAQIKRAFRDLSLKLHPDKRKGELSASDISALDKKFHDITEARSFLLDPEHAEIRKKYDEKLASESKRREEEERRDKLMSASRKRMRHELTSKIETLQKSMTAPKTDFRTMEKSKKYNRKDTEETIDESIPRRTQRREELETRQIHLKWSRSKVGSQSESSIRKLLQERFGNVESVEFIGSKGNAALITFSSIYSCNSCVDAFKYSDEMRATQVSKDQNCESGFKLNTDGLFSERDIESVEQRKLRQAAEREAMLRDMQMDRNDASGAQNETKTHVKGATIVFPPEFPLIETNDQLTPLQRLEFFEKKLLQESKA